LITQELLYDSYLIKYTLYVIIDKQISSLSFISDKIVQQSLQYIAVYVWEIIIRYSSS